MRAENWNLPTETPIALKGFKQWGAFCRATPILRAVGKQPPQEGSAVFQENPLPASRPLSLETQRAGQQRVAIRGHSGPRRCPRRGHLPTAALRPGRGGGKKVGVASTTPLSAALWPGGEDNPTLHRELLQTKGPGSPGEGGQRACGLGGEGAEGRRKAEAVAPFRPSKGFLLETAPSGEEGTRTPSRNKR